MRRRTDTSPDWAFLLDMLTAISEPITGWRRNLVQQGWSPQIAEMLAANALANVINETLGRGK